MSERGVRAGREVPVERGRPKAPILTIVGTVLLVLGAFAVMAWLTSDPGRRASVEGLLGSPTGLVLLFGLSALSTATLILPAPGLVLTAMAGAAGEPLVVGLVAGLGQAVGELTGYAAGSSGRTLLPSSAAADRIIDWLRRWGGAMIFVLALVPNPVFDVAGIAAGGVRMPVWHYLGAAAAGKIIKNWIVAGSAATLGALFGFGA
jgi:membrane protein YqaA with SNARE-associated domain